MTCIASFFNNKGGVGKTTLLYHVAAVMAEDGHNVLMVDADSQCNLTAYSLSEKQIEKAWEDNGNSIWRAIEPVARTIGDIRNRAPTVVDENLSIVPGDLLLSVFEDLLGETWNSAKGGSEAALRAQSALYRAVVAAAEKAGAEVVLVDLGPNLGALNRAMLSGSDYFVVPIAPDLFSIRGTENLGSKLVKWRKEWDQANAAWAGGVDLQLPHGKPRFAGFVTQQHNLRNTNAGMTHGWKLFGSKVESAVQTNIVEPLTPLEQVVHYESPGFELSKIPNLHSLVPYSLAARKPIFRCTAADGLKGAHIQKAKESRELFESLAETLAGVMLD
jgi:cellulose biosynthesis protein BcsQ